MKEYLLMVKVRADKEGNSDADGNTRVVPIGANKSEWGWIHPSRLIDPADLEYGHLKAGDTFLNGNGDWCESTEEQTLFRFLIHRKPKPDKWQAWKDRSPFIYAEAADWIKEGIKIGKGDDK